MVSTTWKTWAMVAALAAGVLTGCGDDDGQDDPDLGGPAQSSGGQGGSSGAGDLDKGELTASQLRFVVGDEEQVLELEALTTTSFKNQPVIALPELWSALGRDDSYNDYVFHFEGADGFRPEGRTKCQDLVIDGAIFAQGYLAPSGRSLVWEDDLGFSGCMFVKDLVQIEASAP